MVKCILVRPDYPKQPEYPPFGLMRISSMLKNEGHRVKYVEGNDLSIEEAQRVYITTLFTWHRDIYIKCVKFYRAMFPRAKIIVGGIDATTCSNIYYEHGANEVIKGIYSKAEKHGLDYDLYQTKYSYVFTTRGCPRKCGFCVVKHVEGSKISKAKKSLLDQINPEKSQIMVMDNNFLMNKYRLNLLDELIDLGKPVDFQSGLDVLLLNDDIMKRIKQLKSSNIVFAYDRTEQTEGIIRMLNLVNKYSISSRITIYMLYNWNESPEVLYERLKVISDNKQGKSINVFFMKFRPAITELYVSPKWTEIELRGLRKIVKVYGKNGMIILKNRDDFMKIFGNSHIEFKRKLQMYESLKKT